MPIYKPDSKKAFLTPFGPTIGYFKLNNDIINYLNLMMNENLKDFSTSLVGKVKQELEFSEEIKNYMGNKLIQFLGEYHTFNLHRNVIASNTSNDSYKLFIHNGWFVRQFENEYNPIHIHGGCTLSCVGYLSLPKGIDEEWEEDYKDHYPANGHINFTYGVENPYGCANLLIKPQVGDFYVFPHYLFHCVYPFKTKGERRSFSMNMSFAKT